MLTEKLKWKHHEGESTEAVPRGGTTRSSEEGPEKGMERRVVSRRRVRRHAVREMRVGPSESPCRGRLQTAIGCFGQKPRW